MASENQEKKAEWAWEQLIDKYRIDEKVKADGDFHILAKQIREFREPRLMAKWDSEFSLPAALKKRHLNILPVSRKEYVMSDYKLYEKFPPFLDQAGRMEMVHFKDIYESVNLQQISSESNAINVLLLSDVLDRFLETEGTVETFNGRMGTGNFDFLVDSYSGKKKRVLVEGAQCEIDGGFENDENVIIMEAKNVLHPDFHIRQLYYPYRLWQERVKKPVRLVFSQYANQIFRIFEYGFDDIENYSSIHLIRQQYFSLVDIHITKEELWQVWEETEVLTDDKESKTSTPFPQADSLDRVISLLEHIALYPMNTEEIAQLMNFKERQSDYYFHAGAYLGLFEKVPTPDGKVVRLTMLGRQVYQLPYKKRQLKIVSLILQHRIFYDLFLDVIEKKRFPTKAEIVEKMMRYQVCGLKLIGRRSSSVSGWLHWIFHLINFSTNFE